MSRTIRANEIRLDQEPADEELERLDQAYRDVKRKVMAERWQRRSARALRLAGFTVGE